MKHIQWGMLTNQCCVISEVKNISAFASDLDNWGGGYLVIGAKSVSTPTTKRLR